MSKAVRFDEYGDIDVLDVREVPRPAPGAGQVLVEVRAAAINPGEAAVRKGVFHARWPATFPSGQGSDFAGVVVEHGAGVTSPAIGAEVIGFTNSRASQAEHVVVDASDVTPKPANVPWAVAGSLFVAGTTAFAAVRAVDLKTGDTLVVSAAAGGVGSLVIQLAKAKGAKVFGLAGEKSRPFLEKYGVTPVLYGDGALERVRAATGGKVDAFIDTFGGGYVEMALALGIDKARINTIIDFTAVEKYGVQSKGNADAATTEVLAELAKLVSDGKLEIPIAKTYPLAEVRAAYRDLEQRHTLGKIVLVP